MRTLAEEANLPVLIPEKHDDSQIHEQSQKKLRLSANEVGRKAKLSHQFDGGVNESTSEQRSVLTEQLRESKKISETEQHSAPTERSASEGNGATDNIRGSSENTKQKNSQSTDQEQHQGNAPDQEVTEVMPHVKELMSKTGLTRRELDVLYNISRAPHVDLKNITFLDDYYRYNYQVRKMGLEWRLRH